MIRDVAIIGGGFSGTLLALNLLRHDGPRATLIERGGAAGTGVAYSAARPELVLNVRASNMSAFPDQPDHFVAWLKASDPAATGDSFVSRSTYGEYLRSLLEGSSGWAPDRLRTVQGDALDVRTTEEGRAQVELADATMVAADAVVLAVGNLTPHTPVGLVAVQDSPRYHANPWAAQATQGLRADDTILLVGTGLTMGDVALTLDAQGFGGRIVALSRRGLVPHSHQAGAHGPGLKDRPNGPLSQLVHDIRQRGEAIDWRAAVDELRPFTQAIWGRADHAERARFLRHLRPWWDIHRHRLAPAVAERIAAIIGGGRLIVQAGKIVAAEDDGEALTVRWRPRGDDHLRELSVDRVINCSGPQGDLTRTDEPLLTKLVAQGAITPDAEHLGIEVDAGGRTIGANGTASDRLLAVGPMTRGAFWEIVAVPDIRRQTWDVARRLSNAHWVGGEGL